MNHFKNQLMNAVVLLILSWNPVKLRMNSLIMRLIIMGLALDPLFSLYWYWEQ